MRLKIDGRELPAKTLDKARVRDVAELQRQTGWKLPQIREEIDAAEILGLAITTFLTLRNAGAAPTWDECLDREVGEVEMIEEPGDAARLAEATTTAGGDASGEALALEASSAASAGEAQPEGESGAELA